MMRLKRLELSGFKSFAKKTSFLFEAPITAIVGPNGSGKSNAAEAFRWVLGERSMKSLRGDRGEDLIFNGAHGGAKAGRAAVSLVFDNTHRQFTLDYDEVTLTREVYRDGNNIYSINGSPVRYRDLTELLANASLGTADHYIINQGEADRVLLASARDRRSLVEDALGLRLYQWKIEESEKKLEQVESNLEKVASLRREIAPHLRFLKKQVEKIEEADRFRQELKALYLEYFKREERYLETERQSIAREQKGPTAELKNLEEKLQSHLSVAETVGEGQVNAKREMIEQKWRDLNTRKETLNRQLGRLEGVIEIRRDTLAKKHSDQRPDFSFGEVQSFVGELDRELDTVNRLADIYSIRAGLSRLKEKLQNFLQLAKGDRDHLARETELQSLVQEQTKLTAEVAELLRQEQVLLAERATAEDSVVKSLNEAREAEREVFTLKTRRQELRSLLEVLASRESRLALEEAHFKQELTEAKTLVDQEIMLYKNFVIIQHGEAEPRSEQEKRRHQVERLKIKIEDLGLETGDTLKEYREVTERDTFLAKEVSDLEQAALSLRTIIQDLTTKIDHDFREGLTKINRELQEFFVLMFGGGTAALSLDREVAAPELAGLEITVSLPRKKIRGLEMLSGGERALVSIALLFALSQVNPPPFLVLDETDAALDEANSRKYGEMVENLAKRSQLILITHNRETMSRAGVIYGVTMGADGVSKLLSIKFDEAAAFAK